MPEINTQYPTIPLDGGLDTLSAPEMVAPGKHLVHEDLDIGAELGALNKRRAYTALTKSAQVRQAAPADRTRGFHRLLVDRGALLAVGADDSCSYELSENENRWLVADTAHAFPVTLRHDVLKDIKAQYLDVARVTGWLMAFVCNQPWDVPTGQWRSYAELCCVLVDENDKVARHTQDALSGEAPVTGVKLAAVSDRYFMALWVDGTDLKAAVFDTQNIRAAWSAPVVMATTHATARHFDIASDGTSVFAAYADATKLGIVKIVVTAGAPVVALGTSVVGSSLPNRQIACALDPDGLVTSLLVVYGNSVAGIVRQTINTTTLAGIAAGVLEASITNPMAISCLTYQAAGTSYGAANWSLNTGAISESEQVTTARLFLLSTGAVQAGGSVAGVPWLKPFRYRGVDYFSVLREQHPELNSGVFASQQQEATVYTWAPFVSGQNDALVCRMLPFTADHMYENDVSGGGMKRGRVASVVRGAGDRRFWTVLFEPGVPNNDPSNLAASGTITLFEIDFADDLAGRAIEFDGHVHVAGSVPRRYEREHYSANVGAGAGLVRSPRGLVGLAPFHSPAIESLTPSASTGTLSVGNYLYRFTWEYSAADGRRIVGLPSPAIQVTLGVGQDTVTISLGAVVAAPAARMQPGLRILVWRTVVNAVEPIYYLAGRIEPGTITQPDEISDSDLETRPILYTVSGEVANEGAPPCLALANWKGRLVALNSETRELWISKSLIPGEYPGWSGELAYDTNVHSKRPIFISTIGQTLLVWWEDAIGIVEGEPPSDTNVGGTIRPPVIFATGVGLAERASLVETPVGVFFRSKRGIQLLGPDLRVSFIGADVSRLVQSESWESANAIVAAVYLESRAEVRFMLSHGQLLVGSALEGCSYLVYNLERQQWHAHAIGDAGAGESTSPTIADAVEHGGQMVACWEGEWKVGTAFAWIEDPDAAADPANTLRPRAQQQTGWLDLAGKMGAQRVRKIWLMGTFPEETQIHVEYDYQESSSWVHTVVGGLVTNHVVSDFGTGQPRQTVEVRFAQQYTNAARITIRGHERLLGVARIEVEIEKGAYQRRATAA